MQNIACMGEGTYCNVQDLRSLLAQHRVQT